MDSRESRSGDQPIEATIDVLSKAAMTPLSRPACDTCGGEGEVLINPGYPDPQMEAYVECDVCRGTGEGPWR